MISKRILSILIILILAIIFSETAISPIKAFVEPQTITDDIFLENNKSDLNSKNNRKTFIVTVTGYSSSYDETDDDPYITASGEIPYYGVVATNFLPIGTKIKIPSLFGEKIFVVKDRMNPRYYYRIDVWFPTKDAALNFGIHHNVEVEVLD